MKPLLWMRVSPGRYTAAGFTYYAAHPTTFSREFGFRLPFRHGWPQLLPNFKRPTVMNKLRQFNSDEVAGLVQQWLDVYGRDRQGVNAKAYMWHVFSGGRFPALEGEQALLEYGTQICCEFVVLSNDRDEAFLSDSRPEDRPFSDFYVFPPNLAWTMAFTHEEGWLGPYFARHPGYADLNPHNIAKVKKQEEIAYAKSRGWH